jgi:hypothetical protein
MSTTRTALCVCVTICVCVIETPFIRDQYRHNVSVMTQLLYVKPPRNAAGTVQLLLLLVVTWRC